MKKTLFLLYGVVAYVTFYFTFIYAIGFVDNLLVPKSIDGTPQVPLLQAILTNAALLMLFAVQHSGMARPAFKRWWTKYVPEPIERSTYVMLSNVVMACMMIFWQPMGGVVWNIETEWIKVALIALSLLGFMTVVVSTFMQNHFDLLGMRQVWLYFRGKPYTHLPFDTPYFYKYVRHPLYLGFLIAFWSTPVMTITHLLFAVATTGYILVAIRFEENDLIKHFGEKYVQYRRQVAMIIPFLKKPETAVAPAMAKDQVEA